MRDLALEAAAVEWPKRRGASCVWRATGSRVDAEGVLVVKAISADGYPTEFSKTDWQMMERATT